jgi:hypothetical protein
MVAAINYVSLGMITVDNKKKYTIHWWLILYYVIALLTMTSLAGWLIQSGRPIAAGLTVVLLLVVYTFFGLRWFANKPATKGSATADTSCPDSSKDSSSTTSSIPIVNMCPDFMVVWTDNTTGNVYCYDDKNTYNMRTYNGAGLTTGLSINNVAGQSAYLMKNNGQNTGATGLKSDTGGLRWPFLYMLGNHIDTMTNDQYGAFLRWEGVWDGSTLTLGSAPLP